MGENNILINNAVQFDPSLIPTYIHVHNKTSYLHALKCTLNDVCTANI